MPTDAEQLVDDTIALAEAVRDRAEYILLCEQENKAFQRALAAVVPPIEGETTEEWAERAFAKPEEAASGTQLTFLRDAIADLETANGVLKDSNVQFMQVNSNLHNQIYSLKAKIASLETQRHWDTVYGRKI